MIDENPSRPDFNASLRKMAEWQQTDAGREHAVAYAAAEQRRRREAMREACDDRGVPRGDRLRDAVLDPLDTPAMQAVRSALGWRGAKSVQRGSTRAVLAVLVGPPGNGKSVAIAWAVAQHTRSSTFALARTIASTPANTFPANIRANERWSRADLLAIDELGHEDSGDRISVLIAERYDAGLATVCSTNLDASAFFERYCTPRVTSRIQNDQYRSGAPGGFPYWHVIPEHDLRAVHAEATT